MKETQNNTGSQAKQTAVRTASPGAEISSRASVRAFDENSHNSRRKSVFGAISLCHGEGPSQS